MCERGPGPQEKAGTDIPSKLLSAYPGKTGPERVAVTICGVILLLANVLVRFLWRHAVRAKLLGVNPDGEEIRVLTRRLTPELASPAVLASNLVMIGLGLFAPTAAICGYLAIAVYFLVPLRPLRRQRHQREQADRAADAPPGPPAYR